MINTRESRKRPSNSRQRIAQMFIPLALTACDPADSNQVIQTSRQNTESTVTRLDDGTVIGPDPVVDLEWKKENTRFEYYKERLGPSRTVEMDEGKCKAQSGRVVYDKYSYKGGGWGDLPMPPQKEGVGKAKCSLKTYRHVKAQTRTLSEIDPNKDAEELEAFIKYSGKDPALQLEAIKMYSGGKVRLTPLLFRKVASEQGQLLLIENFDHSNYNYYWAATLTECSPYSKNDEIKKVIEKKIAEIAKDLTKEELESLARVRADSEALKATEDSVKKTR